MDWVKKNGKAIGLVVAMASALCTMTAFIVGSIHGVEGSVHGLETRMIARMDERFAQQDVRFAQLEKDITIIKTVLIMKGMLPTTISMLEEGD